MQTKAFAVQSAKTRFAEATIERRAPGPHDVQIDIAFCGVCHSDLHTARSEWPGTQYPCVPGHEIVGRVSAIGSEVKKFKLGELVGVGCLVDSCQHCPPAPRVSSNIARTVSWAPTTVLPRTHRVTPWAVTRSRSW